MLYRVLLFALLCASPAAAATAIVPTMPVAAPHLPEASPLAVRLYGFRATGEAAPNPMSAANGNWMWDALGGGCIDGGGWDEAFPGEKGDIRSPAFCVPQPCVRLLTPEELARDVVGRELERGEYRTYLERLKEACGDILVSPTNAETDVDLEDLLALAPFELVKASVDDEWDDGIVPAVQSTPVGGVEWVYPSNNRRQRTSIIPPHRWVGGGGGGYGSSPREPSTSRKDPDQEKKTPRKEKKDKPTRKAELPDPPTFPDLPGKKFDPDDPDGPTGPGDKPDPSPQPAAVPLPGGLVLLLSGVAAFFLGRRR